MGIAMCSTVVITLDIAVDNTVVITVDIAAVYNTVVITVDIVRGIAIGYISHKCQIWGDNIM